MKRKRTTDRLKKAKESKAERAIFKKRFGKEDDEGLYSKTLKWTVHLLDYFQLKPQEKKQLKNLLAFGVTKVVFKKLLLCNFSPSFDVNWGVTSHFQHFGWKGPRLAFAIICHSPCKFTEVIALLKKSQLMMIIPVSALLADKTLS